MLLEFFRMAEGICQLVDDLAFLRGQGVGVRRIHSGEVAILHGVGLAVDGNGLFLVVDLIQQQPVVHAVFRVTHDLLTFQFVEDDGDGLIHPGGQQLVLVGKMLGVLAQKLDVVAGGVAILIDFVGI